MGSIVLIKDAERPQADVVDGQQRLTTLTILFSVLRDLAEDAKIDAFVRQEGSEYKGTKDQYRLTLRDRDAGFFQKTIQGTGATHALPPSDGLPDSQVNLVANANLFRGKLQELPIEDRKRLMTYMVQRCFLVVVEASDATAAYRIFAVMNDRGLDLSPTDILKSEIIGALPIEDRDLYTEKWEDIEEELGRDRFTTLFGHLRMIARRQKMRGTLEAEVRQFLQPTSNAKRFIDERLEPLAQGYLEVANQDFESAHFADEINRHLSHLARLDNVDWEAPAIEFIAKFRRMPEAIRKFMADLERLAYGLFILRTNINDRINRYGRVLEAIADGKDLAAVHSPLQLRRREQYDIGQALNGRIYEMTRVRLPLLLRLDEAVSDGSATYDHKVVSVEHVLPQNPKPGSIWDGWFPDTEKRALWTHRLANLVLLSRAKNAQASNYEFERKKGEYFSKRGTSPFALTSQVLGETEWTPKILEERQGQLIKKLACTWRLDTRPVSAEEEVAELLG